MCCVGCQATESGRERERERERVTAPHALLKRERERDPQQASKQERESEREIYSACRRSEVLQLSFKSVFRLGGD